MKKLSITIIIVFIFVYFIYFYFFRGIFNIKKKKLQNAMEPMPEWIFYYNSYFLHFLHFITFIAAVTYSVM